MDSFPVTCCQKNRIDKRKLFVERRYLGYAASRKRYFCGIKVHMIVTGGHPVEVQFEPGSTSDINVLWKMELDIPCGSKLYADGAYNSFELEDLLQEENIQLLAKRRANAKNRIRTLSKEKEISSRRQIVETTFSCITNLFPSNLLNTVTRELLEKPTRIVIEGTEKLAHIMQSFARWNAGIQRLTSNIGEYTSLRIFDLNQFKVEMIKNFLRYDVPYFSQIRGCYTMARIVTIQ